MFMARPWCSCWYWCSRAEGQAAAPQAAPDDALTAEELRDGIWSLEIALGVWGGRGRDFREAWGGDELREARRLLETEPFMKCAARALIKIGDVRKTCDGEAERALKAAQRAVRDVVVMRCGGGPRQQNREAFYIALERAFDRPFRRRAEHMECDEDIQLKAVLTLAYKKSRE